MSNFSLIVLGSIEVTPITFTKEEIEIFGKEVDAYKEKSNEY